MSETVKNNEKIQAMFKAGAHIGAGRSRRHPSTKRHIFGLKNRLELINLEDTDQQLINAKAFVAELSKLGKQILFVGNKNEAREIVARAAEKIDQPFVALRWIGGTLTNFDQIKRRIARLEELTTKESSGELGVYTKKERLLMSREAADLKRLFGGIVLMKSAPGAMFVVDSEKEKIAVTEARKIGIPVIALSSSDCNINDIEYPIVANDRSVESIAYFVEQIVDAYLAGKSNAK